MDDNVMRMCYPNAWAFENEPEDTCEVDPMELAEAEWEWRDGR